MVAEGERQHIRKAPILGNMTKIKQVLRLNYLAEDKGSTRSQKNQPSGNQCDSGG